MNYFVDTEFIQTGNFVDLISIGIVAADGREYYGQNRDCDLSRANPFVKEHVIPRLDEESWRWKETLRDDVVAFVRGDEPTLWAYYGSYDWVAICGTLFGDMVNAPKGFPYRPYDVSQFAYHLNLRKSLKKYVPEPEGSHNALVDARWTKEVYDWLVQQMRNGAN